MQYFWSLSILFLGILISFLIYIIGNRIIRVYLKKKMKEEAPFFVSFVDDSIRIIIILLSVFSFLMITSFGLRVSYTDAIELILVSLSGFLPKILVISIILLVTFIFIKTIAYITKKINSPYVPTINLFLQTVIIIAAILTFLEYMGVKATPFNDLFRVVIYTVGLTIAISLGIAIGLSIQQKMKNIFDNKKPNKKY